MALVSHYARNFTADIGIFSLDHADIIAGTPTAAGSAEDLLGIFQDSSIRIEFDTATAEVPSDILDTGIHGFVENVNTRGQWSVQLGTLLEKTAAPFLLLATALAPGISNANPALDRSEYDRGFVFVRVFRPGGASNTSNLNGFGWISEARLRGDLDSVILQSGSIMGYGPLTSS